MSNIQLVKAAESGNLELVKKMIEQGADIHTRDEYALRWASNYGHLPVVKFLVENSSYIHIDDSTNAMWKMASKHPNIVNYFKRQLLKKKLLDKSSFSIE